MPRRPGRWSAWGFAVKFGKNVCLDSYGYAASAEERAQDLNELVADEEVQMVLFNGGESAVEILPHIDYEAIRRHPKLFCSYSDATSILNTIHARTGLVTYYGPGRGTSRTCVCTITSSFAPISSRATRRPRPLSATASGRRSTAAAARGG